MYVKQLEYIDVCEYETKLLTAGDLLPSINWSDATPDLQNLR